MKNILIYTNPAKEFNEENKTLVKIQIHNSLEMGWNIEDILLYTNFPYEYMGVEAKVVPDFLNIEWDKTSNKIFVIDYLLENKLLKEDLYWYHDFDAYQNGIITEDELSLKDRDLGLTGYGYKPQWNGGSFFFKTSAADFFSLWCRNTFKIRRSRADEKTLTDMTRSGELSEKRYKALNITYNFGMRHTRGNYLRAIKPLRVLHFHPHYNDIHLPYPTKETFMYGKNPMGFPLMSTRLITLFNHYGIK